LSIFDSVASIHIPGSPFVIDVLPGLASPDASQSGGTGIVNGVAGSNRIILLQSLDTFGNEVNGLSSSSSASLHYVRSKGSTLILNSQNISKSIIGSNPGFEYIVTAAGWYVAAVVMQGVPVKGSPYSFEVFAAAASPATSFVFAAPLNTTVLYTGEDVVFFIQSRDQYGNDILSGGDAFRVITLPPSVLSIEAIVTDLFNGKYRVVAAPPQQGIYTFGTQLLNQNVGSPLSVLMRFGRTNATLSAIIGSAVCGVQAGSRATFSIISRDKAGLNKPSGGDRYEIYLLPASSIIGIAKNATFTDFDDGSYTAEFSITRSAQYSLFVTLDGMHVAASPYAVYVSPFLMNTTLSRLQAIQSIRNGTSG